MHKRIFAVFAAIGLCLGLGVGEAGSASAYVQPAGLWSEARYSSPPSGTLHNTECYLTDVADGPYLCETAVGTAYNWPGDNWFGSVHQVADTTQHFVGNYDNTWVCFSHGRGIINVTFTCFNPADY